jgi:hypothetical protein
MASFPCAPIVAFALFNFSKSASVISSPLVAFSKILAIVSTASFKRASTYLEISRSLI